jgi:mannose/fructose-specific phosphotransferase system component IIA
MTGVPGDSSPGEGSVPRVPALLLGHAGFAESLLEVARAIAGPVDDIPCLSNRDLSPEALVETIGATLGRLGLPAVLLIDMAGGSCFNAARRATRGHPGAHLVAGVNLPLLLDFLSKRDRLPPSELVEHILERGRHGISACRGTAGA